MRNTGVIYLRFQKKMPQNNEAADMGEIKCGFEQIRGKRGDGMYLVNMSE